jgi:tetratricopeptide (TPR) repeat protein
MNTGFQRGMVLYAQHRFDLADREFRQALAADPDNATAHAFLALCLLALDKADEALREAEEAIRHEPDLPLPHYARGHALLKKDQYREAEASAREAIRLDPTDADYRALLAQVELDRHRWPQALEAAEQGLALLPDHTACTNLRALALVQLGRRAEAAQTLGSALADDPENGYTHCNQGWALLHEGKHARALEHFREALRLEPELEWARVGIIEALKARYLIYRLMLRFFLWMARKTRFAQIAIMIAFVFGRGILSSIADRSPALRPWIMPILVLTFGFLLLTWIAGPFFNFLLMFNRFGRLALTREERLQACLIGGCFSAAVALFVADQVGGGDLASLGMVFFGLLNLPIVVTFRQSPGPKRRVMAAGTLVLILLCVPLFSFIVLGPRSPLGDANKAMDLFRYFIYGAVFCTWIPAMGILRDSTR